MKCYVSVQVTYLLDRKIILISVSVEKTNSSLNVNEGSPHAERGLHPAVVEQRMTVEPRCRGGGGGGGCCLPPLPANYLAGN